MVNDDLSKKTEKEFNKNFIYNVNYIDNKGNVSLKYDAVLDNRVSLFEDVINKISTFLFGTSNEIKEEMYKNNNMHALSEGNSFDTVAYAAVCGCLVSVPFLIQDQNIQNIIGIDALLRFSPIMVNACADLIKYKETSMDHRIYPGIVGSVRDYVSMVKS